ncbi:hypothetical protein IEO21_06045 [Rhodonia placenta]|uniref:Candidate secreted effector protein n=1 Tax=Rhodonia placenta TaxID=104341 RepID=A0A8H7P116_9APHY|nr:hypothetical protein IEO21_06045 [Postia placenta]
MRTFQVLFLFLAILATTAIADSHVHEDVEGLVARDAWDDDALFARNDAQLDARDDDELYARDWEEYKDHPLVRELIDVVKRARVTSCYNHSRLTVRTGGYYYCVNRSGVGYCARTRGLQVENGECFA